MNPQTPKAEAPKPSIYPSYRYHTSKPPLIVNTQKEDTQAVREGYTVDMPEQSPTSALAATKADTVGALGKSIDQNIEDHRGAIASLEVRFAELKMAFEKRIAETDAPPVCAPTTATTADKKP